MAPDRPSTSRWLSYASIFVVAFAFVSLLPAFWIPPGLPTEPDALVYRLPLLKWMLRHGAYPDWPWTFLDDYPMLGDLLMLPLLALGETAARLVPVLFYFASAGFAALLAREVFPPRSDARGLFLFSFAGGLALPPVLLQSNALMVDNVAATFSLGSLYFLLRRRNGASALSLGLALATRYTTWGFFPGALLAGWRLERRPLPRRSFALLILALLGAAPFVIRNYLLNGNPFFPLLSEWINGAFTYDFGAWGRGKDLVSLLLFPYDLLYANSFAYPIFDHPPPAGMRLYPHHFTLYTVGGFFLAQSALALGLALVGGRKSLPVAKEAFRNRNFQAVLLFFLCHFLFWWFGSQQLRFLGAELLAVSALLSRLLYPRLPRVLLLASLALALHSIVNVHRESWALASGRIPHYLDLPYLKTNLDCVERLEIRPGETVGHPHPSFLPAYGDYDFVFLPPHPYYYGPKGSEPPKPTYLFDDGNPKLPGSVPEPGSGRCAGFRKV